VDVLVVGARCAGAATALQLAAQGARVLVVDRGAAGTDTLSTHALMRGAVVQLHRWGVLPAIVAANTPAIRRTTFVYGGEALEIAIPDKHGVAALYAPRRTVLDRVLVEAAAAAGATTRFGSRLAGLRRDPAGRVVGATIVDGEGGAHDVRAGCVVGADGRHSTVARLAGAEVVRAGEAVTATVYGHWDGCPGDGYRWVYGTEACVGVIATTDDAACVFVTVPASRFAPTFRGDVGGGFRRVLAALDPGLADGLAGREPMHGLHGFGGQRGQFVRSHGPGWALVGDAGYFKDPLTAHGITDALLHAELLARALGRGGDDALAAYDAARTALGTPVFDVTEAIAGFAWSLDEVRLLHRRLARAMAAELDAALAAFGEPAADVAGPVLHDHEVRGAARRGRLAEDEQELTAVR